MIRSRAKVEPTNALVEAAKIAPPAVVSTAIFAGLTVEQWIQALTVLYLVGLVAHQVPKHIEALRRLVAWWQSRGD